MCVAAVKAIEGWLIYGAALNAGRALYTDKNGIEDDYSFGKWKQETLGQLAQDNERFSEWLANANLPFVEQHDRAAAIDTR